MYLTRKQKRNLKIATGLAIIAGTVIVAGSTGGVVAACIGKFVGKTAISHVVGGAVRLAVSAIV